MQSCCFTGHRNIYDGDRYQLLTELDNAIITAIKKGVTVFRNGGALGFDTLAALAVLGLKERFPQIKLYIDVPHQGQSDHWSEHDRAVYRMILSQADVITFVSQTYTAGCMHKRNRYMVDNADMVIAYVRKTKGGSYYTANYAESVDKPVVYL